MLHANISTAALACYVCGNACKSLYGGRSCADYSVTYSKGITIFDNSELLYRVGLMYTASMLYKVHVSLDLVQVQWHFKYNNVF